MGVKVLVVDDSSVIRQQLSIALSQAGFEVMEACDGVDGLNQFAANDGIDLIVSDVNMPNMNGLEMVESIKKDPKGPATPVVMLTTEGDPGLIKRAKEAGAKGWMVKPFNADMLIKTINKLVN